MLHRMDLLSPEARTHINLGAILGPAFDSTDVISVMERYRGISEKDREAHRESVLESLAQAAESGILEEDLTGAGMSMSFCGQENFVGGESVTYKFTHIDWRKNILKTVLDSWKRDMYLLLAESLEAQFEFNSARPDRAIRKLFEPFKGGKKKGKNISVASELALKIGEKWMRHGQAVHSIKIYKRALDFWQKANEEDDILLLSEGTLVQWFTSALVASPFSHLSVFDTSRGQRNHRRSCRGGLGVCAQVECCAWTLLYVVDGQRKKYCRLRGESRCEFSDECCCPSSYLSVCRTYLTSRC